MEKALLNDDDFEEMGWHDSKIYAVAFIENENETMFDIDYILKWTNPIENESFFKFLVVPATLIFRNVYNISFDSLTSEVLIVEISRSNPSQPKNAAFIKEQVEYDWIIETKNGEITFKSVGYKQYARRNPKLSKSQTIDFKERGGISFETLSYP